MHVNNGDQGDGKVCAWIKDAPKINTDTLMQIWVEAPNIYTKDVKNKRVFGSNGE